MTGRILIVAGCFGLWLSAQSVAAQDKPPVTTPAPSEARIKLATRLVELLDSRKQMEDAMDAAINMQMAAMMDTMRKSGLSDAEIAKRQAAQREIPALLMQELKWDEIGREVALIQATVFTDEELRAMIVFFESPAGRAWVDKSPEMMTRMMTSMQQRMVTVMPKILEILMKKMQQ